MGNGAFLPAEPVPGGGNGVGVHGPPSPRSITRSRSCQSVDAFYPVIELRLGVFERGEAPIGEELLAERLVEPLNLAGRGRRSHGRVTVRDPVLAADPIDQHLDRLRTDRPVK